MHLMIQRESTDTYSEGHNTKSIAMNTGSQSLPVLSTHFMPRVACVALCLMMAAGLSANARAQGTIANGTLSGSGSGPYTYDLTFGAGTNSLSPVGSVWYAWVPGSFYLPGAPIPGSAHAPAGWTATISGNSVQFVATSAANDITAGHSLSGFSYQANFTPAQLASAPNSGVSVAYSGGLFSDAGYTFTVQTVVVPEPSTLPLLLAGSAALMPFVRRRL
jgi:hypothetical protein